MNQKDILYYVAQIFIFSAAAGIGVWQAVNQKAEIDGYLKFSAVMVPVLIGILFVVVLYIIRRLSYKDETILNQRAAYLAITAHDLKTPLTAIKWTAEILQDFKKMPEEAVREYLNAITGACQQMFSFIDDLASASKTTVGRMVSENRERVDIGEMTKAVSSHMELLVKENNLRVNLDIDTGLIVNGDINALRRTLANLISNAIKYSNKDSSIAITAKRARDYLVWSVIDTGIGIPKDELQKVLLGYYRAANAKRSGITGTGLGLYYAKKVIQAHKGKLSLSSEINKGTTATIMLPLSDKAGTAKTAGSGGDSKTAPKQTAGQN